MKTQSAPQKIPTLEWSAYEYVYEKKNADWYWVVSIISISLVLIAFIFNDILFGILLLVSALTLILFASRPPRMLHYEINSEGVVIENYLYNYKTLDSFWIEEIIGNSKIIIKSKKRFMTYIVIPIGYLVPDDIRLHLLVHLKEIEHHEPVAHKLMEYFGF